MRKLEGYLVTFLFAASTVLACANTLDAGIDVIDDDTPPAPGFVSPDASEASAPDASGVRTAPLCVATSCPAPFATCPGGKLCASDLSSDNGNCGTCGNACPVNALAEFNMVVGCVDGTCESECATGYADCDGIVDTGCEVRTATDPKNCGACGIDCGGAKCREGMCGCAPETPDLCGEDCVDLSRDALNCGTCGNICPIGACVGSTKTLNVRTGCGQGECRGGCENKWLDCDNDMALGCDQSNGCERPMDKTNNCGACGRKCPTGQECVESSTGFSCERPEECTPEEVFCAVDDSRRFACVDVQSDPKNCGGCRINCERFLSGGEDGQGNVVAACEKGVCVMQCKPGWATCDGLTRDCETSLLRDPMNCGACGVVCDYAKGQPCVGGQCLMTECDPEQVIPR